MQEPTQEDPDAKAKNSKLITILLAIIAFDVLLYYLWTNGYIDFNTLTGICCLSVAVVLNVCLIVFLLLMVFMISYALYLLRRLVGPLFRR